MSDTLEEAVLSGQLFNQGLNIKERVHGDSGDEDDSDKGSDSDLSNSNNNREEEHIYNDNSHYGYNTGVKGVKTDAQNYRRNNKVAYLNKLNDQQTYLKSKSLTTSSYNDNEDEEDDNDEDYKKAKESYRKSRIRQMKMEKCGGFRLFGHLRQIDENNFVSSIDDEEDEVPVVILIKDNYIESCVNVERTLMNLAQVYTSTKFLSAFAINLEFGIDPLSLLPDSDILPTILIYRNGNLIHSLIRPDLEPKSIESLLGDLGVLHTFDNSNKDYRDSDNEDDIDC